MSAPSPKLCLITGAGGFIGTAVTLAFLRAGHTVRGSFRTQAKADDWMHLHAAALDGRFEPVIVPDIAAPHAFDHAMESLDIVVHTASPATLDPKDHVKEVLDPAYHGIMNLLHSAKHHKRIERFIFTSSISAIIPVGEEAPERTYSEKDWNPGTYEQAIARQDSTFTYRASKAWSEKSLWAFKEEFKPSFSVVSLCVSRTYGPPLQVVESMSTLNASLQAFWNIISSPSLLPTSTPHCVDVRDVAKAHLLAATQECLKDERLIVTTSSYTNAYIVKVVKEAFPEQYQGPPALQPEDADLSISRAYTLNATYSNGKMKLQHTDLRQTIIDTAQALYDVQRKLQSEAMV